MIDLFRPYVPREAVLEVAETLRTRWIGQGPKVDAFEREFMALFKVDNAISLNSGTSALDTAYELLNLGSGDEVISTPLTCTATNLALLRRGVEIVWADIDPRTLCISEEDVALKITDKTKAIVQVHLGGIQAPLEDEVMGIPVVSDACQALGVFTGKYTCCSFQAIKHITTGDGGMIVCPDEDKAREAKLMRWFGIDREKKIANNWQAYQKRAMTFDIEVLGTKRHMTDIAAAMGLVGLKYYTDVIKHREKIFNIYKKRLSKIHGIKLIDGKVNTYWLATVLVECRDDFAKMCFEADIDTNMVQIRNDIYKVFGGWRQDLPVMNEIEPLYISIPIGMHISEENAHYICDVIKRGW